MKTKIKNILAEILGYVIFTVIVAILMIGWQYLDEFVCNMDYVWAIIVIASLCVLMYTDRKETKKRKEEEI